MFFFANGRRHFRRLDSPLIVVFALFIRASLTWFGFWLDLIFDPSDIKNKFKSDPKLPSLIHFHHHG
jgi:hypothetical protein